MQELAKDGTRSDPARLFWDLVLGLGVVAYILLALFGGMDSPLIGLVMIVTVGWRLAQPRHRGVRPKQRESSRRSETSLRQSRT